MNITMEHLVRDIKRLREGAGLTQQDLADLSGEPCRTFIAHLEQGRRETLNLEKLYATLHVLLGNQMTPELESFKVEMLGMFEKFKQEVSEKVSEIKVLYDPKKQDRLRPVEKPPKPVIKAVDEIMTARTGKDLHAGEVIDLLRGLNENLTLHNGTPWIPKRRPNKPDQWDLGVVGRHLSDNCVKPDFATSVAGAKKRFIKKGSGLYTANTNFQHPAQGSLALKSVK
jgi:transcriptional regulator with XRE-family HTH domain